MDMKNVLDNYYMWKFKGRIVVLKGREIIYVHVEQRKIYIHATRSRTYCIGGSLKETERKLKDLPMVKTHNSFLVHLNYLECIDASQAVLKGGLKVPVSENCWSNMKTVLESHFGCHC